MPELSDAQIEQEIQKLAQSDIAIPPQPKTLHEVEDALKKGSVNTSKIAGILAQDAALTAAIFRVANSAAYGLRRKLESVDQAIALLGLSQIVHIVKAIYLRKELGGADPAFEKFWERTNDIAQLSTIVARSQYSVCNISPDEAYLAGLFHDCGIAILMRRFPDYFKAFRSSRGKDWPNPQQEDHQISTDHAVVGYMVARHWLLPAHICNAIRYHHDLQTDDRQVISMVSILQMAIHIYNRFNNNDDSEWSVIKHNVLAEIGIHEDSAEEFEEEAMDKLRDQQ